MPRNWRKVFSRSGSEANTYDFSKLIDRVKREPNSGIPANEHIICDIDKTYLETEFESFFLMAKVAFESALAKITVRGASDVLLAARWGDQRQIAPSDEHFPRGLHFVSSSPPQLRPVLEHKLSLDGLDWSSDTFKNQAYNVLKRRMDQLRQHVGYKSAAILQVIRSQGDDQVFYMIGDNAESDTFIYIGIALRLAGKLDKDQYANYLKAAGIDSHVATEISENFDDLPNSRVAGIFIRNAPGYKFIDAPSLTSGVKLFDHFFQVALLLLQRGIISPTQLAPMLRSFHNQYAYPTAELAAELAALQRDTNDEDTIRLMSAALVAISGEGVEASPTNYKLEPLSCDLSAEEILIQAKAWVQNMHDNKNR